MTPRSAFTRGMHELSPASPRIAERLVETGEAAVPRRPDRCSGSAHKSSAAELREVGHLI